MPKTPQPPRYENRSHRIAFVDAETSGLDPHFHEIWELAVIVEDVDADGSHEIVSETLYYPHLQRLGAADPKALEIGRYYTRRPNKSHGWYYLAPNGSLYDSFRAESCRVFVGPPDSVASALAPRLVDVHLAGCTVYFDAAFMEAFLRDNGQCPMWNYHLIDTTVYAAGRLGLRPPWKSKKVAEQYGIALSDKDAHNALADAHLARNLYWAANDLVAA